MTSRGPRSQLRMAAGGDIPNLAGVQLSSALAGFAHIFPESIPKPTQASLEEEWHQLIADAERTSIVATVGDAAAGMVVYGRDRRSDLPADCVLLKLYVRPEYWGSGLGGLLHDKAVLDLREQGFTRARLWVLERNLVARRMYERRGWQLQPWSRTDWPGSGILELGYTLDLVYSSAI